MNGDDSQIGSPDTTDPQLQRALPFDDAPAAPPAAARCGSCGGPADAAGLCASCQRAFHTVLVSPPEPPVPMTSRPAADIDRLFAEFEASAAAAPAPAMAPPPLEPVTPFESQPVPWVAPQPAHAIAPQPIQLLPVPSTEAHSPSAPLAAEPVAAEVVAPAPVAQDPAPVEKPMPEGARVAAAPVVAASHSPAKSNRKSFLTVAASILIVGAIGVPLSKLWFGRQQVNVTDAIPAKRPAPAPAATTKPAPALAPATTPASAPIVERRIAAPSPAPAKTPSAAPAAAPPRADATRVPPARTPGSKPPVVRPVVAGATPPAAAVAEMPLVPVWIVAPEPPPLAPAAPAAPAAPPPSGPFYELRHVDSPPQVATRVAPQIPDSLREAGINDIVIVRVLVSQAGRASLVNLLRRSKSGMALDNEVIAAVRQWTFTPATKRGEAVSCYLHVGVPVGRGE